MINAKTKIQLPKIAVPKSLQAPVDTLKELWWQERARVTITAGVFFAVFVFFHFDVLKRFELVTYDYRCQARAARASDPRVVVIEISDDSVEKIGRWPWDRTWHATMVKILTDLGAKAVAFDVIFSETSEETKDAVFAESIRRSGRVYLAEVFEESQRAQGHKLLTSLPRFTRDARGMGHINLSPDVDGVMRRMPLFFGGARLPQLSLALAADELGLDIARAEVRPYEAVIPRKTGAPMRVPLDGQGNLLINWVGNWEQAFAHYSYIDVIGGYAVLQKGGRPSIPLQSLKGKICYIGTSASGLFDIRPTPLEPSYPAVGVNLTILNNLLENRFIRTLTYGQHLLLLVVLMAVLFRIMKLSSYMRSAIFTAVLAIGYVVAAFVAFCFFGLWINMIYPLTLILTTYVFITLYNQLSIAIERAKLLKLATRDSLTGLFNIGHFKLLLKAEITTISLRREKALSVIMGDVDNFKKTNDTYGHLTGDMVLREVAACVKANCRALDVAARYGGEEFILMLPGANVDQAFKVAENVRKSIEGKVFFHEKGDFQTSISIGVTQVSPEDKDMDAIIARADRALYDAKHTGKNRVVIAADSPKVLV